VATLQAKAPARVTEPWSPRAAEVVAILCVVAALVGAYFSSFRSLVAQWNREPNYSYGFFVIPIALVIFWSRRGMIDRNKVRPHWWGFLPLLAVVALRYPLFERNEQYVETATIPLVLTGLVFALGGWHLLRAAWPSLVFLLFMLPLPPSVNGLLAQPLQRVATAGSVLVLQLMGMPVMAEGNVIIIGSSPLEVARACNGLSMLLSFITLVTAVVLLVQRPLVERVLLLASAIPIALVSNIVRITVTALCAYWFGSEAVSEAVHEYAGYAMMPLALFLVWLELAVYSWLFVEVQEVDATTLLRRGRGGAARE
jgi:exosortase